MLCFALRRCAKRSGLALQEDLHRFEQGSVMALQKASHRFAKGSVMALLELRTDSRKALCGLCGGYASICKRLCFGSGTICKRICFGFVQGSVWAPLRFAKGYAFFLFSVDFVVEASFLKFRSMCPLKTPRVGGTANTHDWNDLFTKYKNNNENAN